MTKKRKLNKGTRGFEKVAVQHLSWVCKLPEEATHVLQAALQIVNKEFQRAIAAKQTKIYFYILWDY